jgi:phage-related protein
MADFGLKIGVEGEREFKAALRDINQAFKVLGSEVALVTSQFDKNDRSVNALTARSTVLNKQISAQKNEVELLKLALQNSADSFGENDKRTQDWQIKLNKAQAELNKLERELRDTNKELSGMGKASDSAASSSGKLTGEVDKFGKTTERGHVTVKELGGLIKDSFVETGGKAKTSLTDLGGKIKTAFSDGKEKVKSMGQGILDFAKDTVTGENSVKKLGDVLANKLDKSLNDTEKSTKDLGKSVDKAGDELNDTGKETKKLGEEMDDTGKKTSVFGDVLKANLAADAIKAGLKALVDSIRAVGAAVKDYMNDSMELATEAAMANTLLTQVMGNMMDATEGEISALNELIATQEKQGVVSKTAQTTALAELASFVERKESLEDMLPVMNDYIAYQYGATASSEQARNVATSLGKAIDGNIDGLSKQGFKLTDAEKEWFKTATEMERVEFVTNMVSESMEGVNEALAQTDAGKMANLGRVMDNTKISIGSMANEFKAQILGQMLPSISVLSDAFVGVVSGEGSVEEMADAFDAVFNDVVKVITEFLPKLIDIGSKLITAVAQGLSQNIDVIIKGAIDLVNQLLTAILDLLPIVLDAGMKLLFGLVDGIIQALPSLVEAAVQLVISLVDGITAALPKLIPAALEAILTIVDGLLDNLPKILDAALQLILGLTEGIITALPRLIQQLPKIIIGIVDFLIKAIPQIIQTGITLLVSLVQALPQIIQAIVKAIPQIITGLVNAITNNIPAIIKAGVQLLVSLVKETPKIVWEVVKAIPQIIKGILGALKDAIPQLINMGSELIKGLWQGISNVGQWLRDKISGFFGGVVSSIKNFFGIKSPSTLFRDQIGKNMALGVGEGFAAEMEKVSKDMQEAIPTDFDTDLDINAGIRSSIGGMNSLGDYSGLLDGITTIMLDIFPAILEALDIKVVLDDGTLVGKLAPEIDRNLALLRRRGLVGV